MSWLFGLNKGQQSDVDLSSFQLPPAGSGGADDKNSKDSQGQKAMEAYRFDSAALERAAKAAKELERSRTYVTCFVNGRQQRVVLNGNVSSWLYVISGVPQGVYFGAIVVSHFYQ